MLCAMPSTPWVEQQVDYLSMLWCPVLLYVSPRTYILPTPAHTHGTGGRAYTKPIARNLVSSIARHVPVISVSHCRHSHHVRGQITGWVIVRCKYKTMPSIHCILRITALACATTANKIYIWARYFPQTNGTSMWSDYSKIRRIKFFTSLCRIIIDRAVYTSNPINTGCTFTKMGL